jgi:hypothetical protein
MWRSTPRSSAPDWPILMPSPGAWATVGRCSSARASSASPRCC